jgi:dihydropteroate synthase
VTDSRETLRWRVARDRELTLDRPRILGILNVTPDSFSDGGRYVDPDVAADAALQMVDDGASVIDVGGESTRPGAGRVDAQEQLRRAIPVIERIRSNSNVLISVDTTLSEVARAALDAGAQIINDVSAGEEDPRLIDLAAGRGCGLILMHRHRRPEEDAYSTDYASADAPRFRDVVAHVAEYLGRRAAEAHSTGVDSSSIVVDPGLGFGKTVAQNYELIAKLDHVGSIGYPVLCGASRKSFLSPDRSIRPADRIAQSIAVAVAAYQRGVRLFRVHDVALHRDALKIAACIDQAGQQLPIGSVTG